MQMFAVSLCENGYMQMSKVGQPTSTPKLPLYYLQYIHCIILQTQWLHPLFLNLCSHICS